MFNSRVGDNNDLDIMLLYEAAATMVFSTLLAPERIERIAQQSYLNESLPSLSIVLNMITNSLFPTIMSSNYHLECMAVFSSYWNQLLSLYTRKNNLSALTAAILVNHSGTLSTSISNRLEQLNYFDPRIRDFMTYLVSCIGSKTAVSIPPALPLGPPI